MGGGGGDRYKPSDGSSRLGSLMRPWTTPLTGRATALHTGREGRRERGKEEEGAKEGERHKHREREGRRKTERDGA